MTQRQRLAHVIRSTPIIDNHAHPLLTLDAISRYPLLAITTEAGGDAIHDSMTGLAHIRGVMQLARLLGCTPSWEAVVNAIEEKRLGDYGAWVGTCLSGIEAVLVDDGLDSEDDVFPYGYFDRVTPSKAKRIVRIEKLAQQIIEETCFDDDVFEDAHDVRGAFETVLTTFSTRIERYIEDPEVVGFKSIICYRTGLDIPGTVDVKAGLAAFEQLLALRAESADAEPVEGGSFRLQHPGLNELFVHRLACLIRDSPGPYKKPIQFHTGLGDKDITLTRASPSHLQEFIRRYPTVPIVLLHASYPFTKEAGYLATVYSNVYADIGEVFPFVSQDGQERLLREILELCPWSKILWSTDGHWFPETYYLATAQVREVLEIVSSILPICHTLLRSVADATRFCMSIARKDKLPGCRPNTSSRTYYSIIPTGCTASVFLFAKYHTSRSIYSPTATTVRFC
jgi:Amidohydrolase